MDKAKPKKYEERLMDVFAFDEDDVDANQAGQFSRRQLDRLNSGRNSARYGGALLAFLGLMALAILLPAFSASGGTSVAALIVPLLIGMVFMGIAGLLAFRARKLSADLRENHSAEIEGRVELQMKTGQNSASYFVIVDKMRFTLKKKAFLAFKNGDPYRIYYAPHSKRILSVEWLRENDNPFVDADAEKQASVPVEAEIEAAESDNTKHASQ